MTPLDDSPIKIFLAEKMNSNFVYTKELELLNEFTDKQAVMIPIIDVGKKEISAIKKLKRSQTTDIYLLLSDSPSLDTLLQTKRDLSAQGIRRSKRVRYIASIGSMYALLNAKSLLELGIDGLVFDTITLANSYRPGMKELDSELLALISQALDSIKNQKFSYIGMQLSKDYLSIPLRKELHAVVKKGISSLVFPESSAKVNSSDVSELVASIMKIQLG